MWLNAETMRFLLMGSLIGMAYLGVFFLRGRRMAWWSYTLWGLLTVLLPAIGPFLVILLKPGNRST